MRVSSVRTRTRWRYAVFRTSAGSFGSILESSVPSTSTMRSMPSSVVLSPPRISPSFPHALRPPEYVKALRVVRAAVPHDGLEAFDGLDIVVKHVHAGVDDGPHRLEVSLEIRDEGLDEQVGAAGLDLPHRLCEVGRASVGQVVAIDRCEHDVGEVHFGEGDRHFGRFV